MTLVLAVCLVQNLTGEEILKKIEDRIDQSTTFSCRFEAQGSIGSVSLKVRPASGLLFTKGDDKFALRCQKMIDRVCFYVCDGDWGSIHAWRGDQSEWTAPKDLKSTLVKNFVRVGASLSFQALRESPGEGVESKIQVDLITVKDFIREPEDKDAGAVTFKAVLIPDTPAATITLWYDPKTYLPLRRRVELGSGEEETTLTEVYRRCLINQELPATTFRIPEEK